MDLSENVVKEKIKSKRVLIIDALNQYYRNYIVDPSLSTNGDPIGGLKGFLKSLQKQVREIRPDYIIICWDGEGGSRKRRAANKDYKSGRKPIRLNRSVRNMSENEEIQNKIWQQLRLFEYLNNMPVIQIKLDDVEADDIIAHVANSRFFKNFEKVIVSSDKDFIQLCSEKTILYRPIQKEVLNMKNIIEKYNIHPTNFALARAMGGDSSDNISGIRGVGLITVAKRFPFLREEKSYTVDDLLSHSREQESKLKIYEDVSNNRKLILENYKLMQLYSPLISPQGKRKINYILENFEFDFNKTKTITYMIKDGMGEYNWIDLWACFKRICWNKHVP